MATTHAANELKQQGAIEAAQDPESKVSSNDAQRQIVANSKQAGVTAFTFNPNDSVEEKKAQVQAVCLHLFPLSPSLTTESLIVSCMFRQFPRTSTEGPAA